MSCNKRNDEHECRSERKHDECESRCRKHDECEFKCEKKHDECELRCDKKREECEPKCKKPDRCKELKAAERLIREGLCDIKNFKFLEGVCKIQKGLEILCDAIEDICC